MLYFAAAESTINMVLVKEDDKIEDHIIYYLSRWLVGPELNYTHVEKLALAVVHDVQRFRHYILLRKTIVIVVVNHFQYVLTGWVIDREISRWIVILQEFELDFVSVKYKKSLIFSELISKLLVETCDISLKESPINKDLFPIASSDPWYGDILVYIHTLKCPYFASHNEHRRICHQARNYLILNDTLYHRWVDCILRRCLTHKEA